ncbi:MAG: glycosyltransferase family 1 protein [Alphaproteobacteria bacterium]|nr:glycosyltransferase family 1 protein [Alphaproteobacteria bacterium]MBU0876742.1 glycosyltransferase family 1 protein [Alphaproteobacteria bacterium]MBU1768988.1 glycosyltransferase family 1 protein [Alphaproteobacteria bacterium]
MPTPSITFGETCHAHIAAVQDPAIRVALFSGNYNYLRDGANQALNRLVSRLEQDGVARFRIYSPTRPNAAFSPAGTLVSAPSLPIPGRSDYLLSRGLTPGLRRDLEAFAPDVVHVSAPDFLGHAAAGWARRHGIPTVASLHTRFETYPEHYGMPWLGAPLERWLRYFYSRFDVVLAPTEALTKQLVASGAARRARLWSRGVDRDLFHPGQRSSSWRERHGIWAAEITLLFFGRLVREKGLDEYARAVIEARRRGAVVKPVVIGDGPHRARLERLLPDALFTGHLSSGALATAVASCDILLHPSRTEAFPNVVLEAMSSGLAIVANDDPSVRALIDDNRTGVLCGPTLTELVNAVLMLAASSPTRERLADAARAHSARFDWSSTLQPVATLYAELSRGRSTS